MGMIEVARDALKDIPISEVLRERILFALDRLSEAEGKIETLQMEIGGLKAQLERERADHEKTKQELKAPQDDPQHEEIRFVLGDADNMIPVPLRELKIEMIRKDLSLMQVAKLSKVPYSCASRVLGGSMIHDGYLSRIKRVVADAPIPRATK